MSACVKPYTTLDQNELDVLDRHVQSWRNGDARCELSPNIAMRLLATARAGLEANEALAACQSEGAGYVEDRKRMAALSDPEFWERVYFNDEKQQWVAYHGHTIPTEAGGLAANLTYHDDFRAAIDAARGVHPAGPASYDAEAERLWSECEEVAANLPGDAVVTALGRASEIVWNEGHDAAFHAKHGDKPLSLEDAASFDVIWLREWLKQLRGKGELLPPAAPDQSVGVHPAGETGHD